MSDPEQTDPGRVTVLVVDDLADMRALVRLTLDLDGRYQIVGEATDGLEGIAAAERLQPEVVLLDRSMPRMDGITALPQIRAAAPHAKVVLYTAENDAQVHQAAVAAGATEVIEKNGNVTSLGSLLADALVSSPDDPADLAVHVGPLPSTSALEWIANTARILRVVRVAPWLTDIQIDAEVLDCFDQYLDAWHQVAEADTEFYWAARASAGDVERLIEAWASIDRIDISDLHAYGCEWSAPHGREFFSALTTAVMAALADHERTRALSRRLEPQWSGTSDRTTVRRRL